MEELASSQSCQLKIKAGVFDEAWQSNCAN
jgi:hypothetical protein